MSEWGEPIRIIDVPAPETAPVPDKPPVKVPV
jgi:hypothetical protein